MGIWQAIANFLGIGKEVYRDIKNRREKSKREKTIEDVREGRVNSAWNRLLDWLREPREKSGKD